MSPNEIKVGGRYRIQFGTMRRSVEAIGLQPGTPFWRGRDLMTGGEIAFAADSIVGEVAKPVISLDKIRAGNHLLNRAAKALDAAGLPGGKELRAARADSIGGAIAIAQAYVDIEQPEPQS